MKNLIDKYYSDLFQLLGIEPKVSNKNIALLQSYERQYDIHFPEAVKAWYAIENWKIILKNYSSFDDVEDLETLLDYSIWNNAEADEISTFAFENQEKYNQLIAAKKLVSAFSEHQGAVQWLFLTEKSLDAKVWASFDLTYPEELLTNFPNTFSELIYLSVWDAKLNGFHNEKSHYYQEFSVTGNAEQHLAFLAQQFQQRVTTDLTIYPKIDRKIARFDNENGMVAYWEQTKSSLILSAFSLFDFKKLLFFFVQSDVFLENREAFHRVLNKLY